ncbi:unnamed protein product [Calypogeia fissa]
MQCLRASFRIDCAHLGCPTSTDLILHRHPPQQQRPAGWGGGESHCCSSSPLATDPVVVVRRGHSSASFSSASSQQHSRRVLSARGVDERIKSHGGLWNGQNNSLRELSGFGRSRRLNRQFFSSARLRRVASREGRRFSAPRAIVASKEEVGEGIEDSSGKYVQEERVGVLLLNLGGPETLEDVEPFLYNLFADPDIIRLPRLFRFMQQPLAEFISKMRAPKSTEAYKSIGGGSPLRRITDEQAAALERSLAEKNLPAKVYVGMRYWHPFTEEAIYQIKQDEITRLVVLPLYPQFSISTSGSSLRLLEGIFRMDEYLVNMQHTVIPSWYQREGYVQAMSTLIEKELAKFERPDDVNIFFSAHGVPLSYVEDAGDPYKAEMEECVELITEELKSRGVKAKHTLAYQSRVGPVEWLKPYTDTTIVELGKKGVKSLLAVPISFVSEHIETLEEIDMEYRELALESGIVNWGRVPALGCDPTFIDDLADAVIEALPYVGAMAVSNLEARQSLVPLGKVEELLATYDTQRRGLPAPVAVWEWGWTKSAETWNGRVAMLAVVALLVLEVSTGKGVLHQWGIFPFSR